MRRLFLILSCCALFVGCASPQAQQEKNASPTDSGEDYKIGVDDMVQVSVWRNPEMTVTVPVRPDGKISVPLAGDVRAGGLTAPEVATAIEQKLSYYIRDPKVTVIITALHSHAFLTRVRVTGAVRTPMSLPHRPGMTVLDAVLEAGGPNEFAAPNRTRLHRKGASKVEVIPVRLGDILNNGRLQSNVDVRPGDVITVPESLF